MNQSDTIKLEVPAKHKYLNVVGACITSILERVEDIAESATVAYGVELAVHETCTNIVEHAYAGVNGLIHLSVTVEQSPKRLVIELKDNGRSFDPAKVPEPNLEESQVNGYGLFLMHQLMDRVDYYPQSGQNRWCLVKNLEPRIVS